MTPLEFTEAREALHLNQRQLSEVLGIHPNVVNRWERGSAKIPPYMWYTLLGIKQFVSVLNETTHRGIAALGNMTKKELLAILQENNAGGDGDWEEGHWHSDEALIAYINDPEIAEAFEKVGRWYA